MTWLDSDSDEEGDKAKPEAAATSGAEGGEPRPGPSREREDPMETSPLTKHAEEEEGAVGGHD